MTQSFGRLEEGYESALKDYYKKQIGMLNNLITLLLGSLSKGERQKVGTIFIDQINHKLKGDDNLHNRCSLEGCCEQNDSEQDRVFFRLHVAVPASTQVIPQTHQNLLMSEVGRDGGGLLRKYLRRRVPVLARVSGKYTETCDNTPH